MDAASAEVDIDFGDLSFLDGLECFDLDLLPAEFGGGDYFLAGPGKEGGLGLDLGSFESGHGCGRESSPDSVVTDDGASSSSGDRDDGGEMSDYVSELERFLMEDDHDYEAKGDLAADENVLGGHFGAETIGAEEELSPNDYFLDEDYYVADNFCTEPGSGDAVKDVSAGAKEEEEELAADNYFFGNYYVTGDDGYAEPAASAGVVDPASPALEEDEEEDAAAREDEATSRKRASIHPLRQRRCACAGSVPSEAELVLTRMRRCISVQLHGCHRHGYHRLLCGIAWLLT